MQEFLPLQALSSSFKADIRKLTFNSKDDRTALYAAQTSFGDMTLIVETIHHMPPSPTHILQRNQLMAKQQLATPLVYEQQLVRVREDYAICLTLCELIAICRPLDLQLIRAQSLFEGLVRGAYKASRENMAYEVECLKLERLMVSQHNSSFFMDFTRIGQAQLKQEEALELFKQALCELILKTRTLPMQQMLFICESPFVFNLDRISQCSSWFDFAMMFNLLHHDKVTVVTESRTKILPINKLTGPNRIQHQGITYPPFLFKDGFRLDGITELTLEQLKAHFFQDKMVYYMTKEKYMCVRKEPAARQQWNSRIESQDLIYVRPQISKVQFINFLIGYVRFIDPVLHEITFHADQNALQLAFSNRMGKARRMGIKFHPKYVVKDEELSMIIEKSKLKNASVSLQRMAFGDSFLIFLANCDKMSQVKALSISHCSKITQSGVSLLLASPFCKRLQILKVNGLPLPDFEAMKCRPQLKELFINDCLPVQEGEEVYVGGFVIQRLQSIGMQVNFKFPQTIHHLILSQEVSIQNLKILKNLPLISLKIKLVQNKKTITSFFNSINNLYSKDNPIRAFSEGSCHKTLRSLDASHSTIKLKDLKPILLLQCLQTLICEGMERDKFADLVLPHHILSLSLKGSKVNAQIVQEMTHKINFFIRLSLLHTDVTEKTLQIAIKGKKYISLLQVGEEQVDLNFFNKKTCVEGLQLHLHKLVRDDNEAILNSLLYRQLSVCKQLNLRCQAKLESRLTRKVHRFLSFYHDSLRAMVSELTLNINSISIFRLLPLRVNRDSSGQNFTVVNSRSSPHRVKINARTLLAEEYRLPLMEEYLSMQLFNVTLHKVLQLHPQSLLEVSIRNNRLLSANAITLLRKYAGNKLLSLDFRNCLFSYSQVQQQLYEFLYLESVNEGEYEISILQDDRCEQELQKVLKFFMKLNTHEKMKLKLKAHAISQRQLFFSILFEVIHHHSAHIISFDIDFDNMIPDHQSLPFWRKIFLLQKLQTLHIRYINDHPIGETEETNLAIQFEKMMNLNLFSLEMQTSIRLIIPMQLSFKDLRRLSLAYSEMEISQHVVARLLKSTPSLNHLTLKLQYCQNISSVSKISDALQRMPNLVHLSLNLQNTSVKQSSLFELIDSLHRNILLERVEVNLNNCQLDINELVKVCEMLVQKIRFCHILLYALQPRRPAFFRKHEDLLALGIELVFTS